MPNYHHIMKPTPQFASGDQAPKLPSRPWPHAPTHRLSTNGTYFVTAGTYLKARYFHTDDRLTYLEEMLLTLAATYGWHIEAWAVLSNHYHFVAHSPPDATTLEVFQSRLHTETAIHINRLDGKVGRKVWFNYRDTKLTFEKSYLARLHYVHQNAAHHRLVLLANQWRWCSAAWFERTASPAMVKTIYSFKIDQLQIYDDY
jgi:putative transposase